MTTFKNEKYGAEITLPEITGLTWTRYWAARFENAATDHGGRVNPGEVLAEQIAGLQAIAEVAVYVRDGKPRKLDMDAPLELLRWAAQVVDDYLYSLTRVPKN